MFDRAICELQQLTATPVVSIDALFDLKQLLDASSILMQNRGIGQAERDTLSMAGDSHATVAAPRAHPTELVPATVASGDMGGVAEGDAGAKSATADETAAAALEPPSRPDTEHGAE
jgi:hypothetical protein